jgi:hypothetical protein
VLNVHVPHGPRLPQRLAGFPINSLSKQTFLQPTARILPTVWCALPYYRTCAQVPGCAPDAQHISSVW